MGEKLDAVIDSVPAGAFREPPREFARLSPLERLHWLQQTAHFIWKHGGAARRDRVPAPDRD